MHVACVNPFTLVVRSSYIPHVTVEEMKAHRDYITLVGHQMEF